MTSTVPAGFAAYIDTNLGDDATGELQNVALPFKTFGAAILKIGALTPGAPWVLQARSGVYVEDVTLPPGVSINGSNAETVIVGSLVVNGGVISNIYVTAGNVPALVLASGGNYAVNCFFSSAYDDGSAGQASVVIAKGASYVPTATGTFSSSTGSSGAISVYLNRGECNLDQCITELSLTGPAPAVFANNNDGAGSLFKMQQSSTKVTHASSQPFDGVMSVLRNDSGTAYLIGHRAELYSNSAPDAVGPAPAKGARFEFATAVGESSTQFAFCELGFGANLPAEALRYATGELGAISGARPTVGAQATQFFTARPDVRFLSGEVLNPPFGGVFAKLEYSALDQKGSLATSGGLALATKIVDSSYRAVYDDSTILVKPRADDRSHHHRHRHRRRHCHRRRRSPKVTLPDPAALSRVSIAQGKILVVKNGSGLGDDACGKDGARQDVRVVGKIADGEIRLAPGQAATFQIIGQAWHLLSRL
jgi:hypothetical protein